MAGAKCPENSIGIGPDCLCMDEKHIFIMSEWKCGSSMLTGSECIPPSSIQRIAQRLPLCDYVDHKVLISSIG